MLGTNKGFVLLAYMGNVCSGDTFCTLILKRYLVKFDYANWSILNNKCTIYPKMRYVNLILGRASWPILGEEPTFPVIMNKSIFPLIYNKRTVSFPGVLFY